MARIRHVAYMVEDMEAVRDFYVEAFGFEEVLVRKDAIWVIDGMTNITFIKLFGLGLALAVSRGRFFRHVAQRRQPRRFPHRRRRVTVDAATSCSPLLRNGRGAFAEVTPAVRGTSTICAVGVAARVLARCLDTRAAPESDRSCLRLHAESGPNEAGDETPTRARPISRDGDAGCSRKISRIHHQQSQG